MGNDVLLILLQMCFVCRISLGCFAWRTGWICLKWFSCLIFIVDQKKEAMLVKQHFFINNVDWEVRRMGMRERVKTRNDNGLRDLDIFTKIAVFWGKNVSKTNLGSTIHYTYTSYNTYFRLCMVSEELRLNVFSSIEL